jgi:hypothetical protein
MTTKYAHVAVASDKRTNSLEEGSEEFSFHIEMNSSKALTKIAFPEGVASNKKRKRGRSDKACPNMRPRKSKGVLRGLQSVIYGPHFVIKILL